MQKFFSKLIVLIIIGLVILGMLGFTVSRVMEKPNTLEAPLNIEFKRGSTIRTLANTLEQNDLIEYPDFLVIWARINGYATRLQAGEYEVKPGETLNELLEDIVTGQVKQYSLTLVEGWNFKQFMQAIHEHDAIEHTLKDLSNEEIMKALGFDGEHPEGRFFPDTYFIHKNTRDVDLLLRAHTVMEQTLQRLWKDREDGLPLKTPYEALILASIVEKETGVVEERPLIAGVFINRLRKKMRLQTDPTVIYGLGDKYDGDIRFRDLRTDTPYNTYTRSGLTPTPIAMPGIGALEAVMHPAKTEYLYFVAYSDNSGRHKFSSTLAEHEKAVDQYQRKR